MTQDSSTNINLDMNEAPKAEPKKEKLFTAASLHNAKFNIRQNLKMMIVLFVLHFAAAPLVLITTAMDIGLYTRDPFEDEVYLLIGVLTTAIAVLLGAICAVNMFPYLFKKSKVDMHLSLPMTTSQRFLSDYLSGLFVYLVPFFAADVISVILTAVMHAIFDGKTYTYKEIYSDQIRTWTCTFYGEIFPYLIKAIIGGTIIMLMFYALTVLVMSCCGTLADGLAYAVIANGAIPGVIAVVVYGVVENLVGLSSEYYLTQLISFTSPGGALFGFISSLAEESYADSVGIWALKAILVTVVFIVGSFFLYRARKAEQVGTPFVFKAFFHVMMTAIFLIITILFLASDDDMIIPMLIVTFILYMLFAIAANRGFKKIVSNLITYVITIAGCAGFFVLATATGGFGAESRIPAPSEIKSAYVTYFGELNVVENNNDYNYYSGIYGLSRLEKEYSLSFTDRENITVITDFHRSAYEAAKNGRTDFARETLTIKYKLKNGSTVFRTYSVTSSTESILRKLDCTPELRRARADIAENQILGAKRSYESRSMNMNMSMTYKAENYVFMVSPMWQYRSNTYSSERLVRSLDDLPEDFTERFIECLRNDIMNEPEDEYRHSSGRMWFINLYNSGIGTRIILKESYTETLAYLASLGITDLPEVQTEDVTRMANEMRITITSGRILDKLYPDHPDISSNNADMNVPIEYEYGLDYADIGEYSSLAHPGYSDELYEIMKNSRKMYSSDEAVYTITVDGNTAVVLPQYSDIAEKCYIRFVITHFIDSIMRDDYYYDNRSCQTFINAFLKCYSEAEIREALADYYEYGLDVSYILDAMKEFAAMDNGSDITMVKGLQPEY